MRIERILVVDDDDDVRRILTELLRRENYTVLGTSSVMQAKDALKQEHFDLILSDLVLKEANGLEFLKEVREQHPKTQAMLMTGYASMETAVQAIRIGIFDYLIKPINPAQLNLSLKRLESFRQLESENRYLRSEQQEMVSDEAIWGESPAMQEVLKLIKKVAQTPATVLIQGESGTGKEMVARAICQNSPRANAPFVKVNCAAVPETLLESEFFGHERGAFTGAVQKREGRFETAHGGTLLLDEISEIPLSLQVKLLRVLQEQEFERVGGNKTVKVDVRIIASTNRNLQEEVKNGRFREDLFYRLNVVPIYLPPLRERGNDMEHLLKHFIATFSRKHHKEIRGVTDRALEKLREYRWSGNVRELQNIVERSIILATPGNDLDIDDFALPGSDKPANPVSFIGNGPLPSIPEMERRLIGMVLSRNGNNKTKAAKQLGISLRTLRNKLNLYRREGYDVEAPETLFQSGPETTGSSSAGPSVSSENKLSVQL